eukprot:5834668-Pleurochrysis_carterae.AAC.1
MSSSSPQLPMHNCPVLSPLTRSSVFDLAGASRRPRAAARAGQRAQARLLRLARPRRPPRA